MPYIALIISAVLLLLFAVVRRVVRSVRMTDTMRRITRESRADARRSASAARLGIWHAALIPAPVPVSPVPASPAAPRKTTRNHSKTASSSPAAPCVTRQDRSDDLPANHAEPAPKPSEPATPNPFASVRGNNAFVGEVVSFTGTLPYMKRADAISAVKANGGKAFAELCRGVTLLVIGDKPGAGKLVKASRWNVKTIDAFEFRMMLQRTLHLELSEFRQYLESRKEVIA